MGIARIVVMKKGFSMKRIVIVFGIAILLINLVALATLYFVLRPPDTNTEPQFMVITADVNDRSGLLNTPESILTRINNSRMAGTGLVRAVIDYEMAAIIAHMLVLDSGYYRETQQPYSVFFDEENVFFVVFAQLVAEPDVFDAGGVYRVIVCGGTGGVLSISFARAAGVPSYD